jgi:hypothetical protein
VAPGPPAPNPSVEHRSSGGSAVPTARRLGFGTTRGDGEAGEGGAPGGAIDGRLVEGSILGKKVATRLVEGSILGKKVATRLVEGSVLGKKVATRLGEGSILGKKVATRLGGRKSPRKSRRGDRPRRAIGFRSVFRPKPRRAGTGSERKTDPRAGARPRPVHPGAVLQPTIGRSAASGAVHVRGGGEPVAPSGARTCDRATRNPPPSSAAVRGTNRRCRSRSAATPRCRRKKPWCLRTKARRGRRPRR